MEIVQIYQNIKRVPFVDKIFNLLFAIYLIFFFYWGREDGFREIPTKILTPIFAIFALIGGAGKYIFLSEPLKRYFYFTLLAIFSYTWAVQTTPALRQIQMMVGILAISLVLFFFIIKYNTASLGFIVISIGCLLMLKKGFELSSVTFVSALDDLSVDKTLKSLEENENSLACLYLIGICSLYAFIGIVKNNILNYAVYVGIFSLLYGISLTGSRSTLMAGALLIVLNFLFTKSIKLSVKILLIIAFSLFAFGFIENILFASGAGEKLRHTGESYSDYVRKMMLIEAWNMFIFNPVLGVGIGNVFALSTFGLYAHNDLLEVAATLGIVGISLYLLFIKYYIDKLRKLKKINPELYVIFFNNLIIYLFMGLFGVWFTDAFLFILLFMQIAETERLLMLSEKLNKVAG